MLPVLIATGLPLATELVRVEDPNYPGALARSENASVIAGPPPPGTPWMWEPLPVEDAELQRTGAYPGLEVTNADLWHAAGITGAGVRVAVFDTGWFGGSAAPEALGPFETADCWRHTSCEVPIETSAPRFGNESGVHGFACAEVVRNIAPDAELFLVRSNGLTAFENAARWAIRNDIDVVSMSLSFYSSSFYDGSGPFDEVMRELETAGVLLVTSSGNNAAKHWWGPWRDVDGDGRMDGTDDNALWLDLPAGGSTVTVNWNQHRHCGDTDLDAYAYNADGDRVGRSESEQDPEGDKCSPIERFEVAPGIGGLHRLEIVHRSGPVGLLELDVLTSAGTMVDGVREGSLGDPAAHEFAYAVGAVNADNYGPDGLERFSAWGPNHAGRMKPDLAGPDGLTTYTYGPRSFHGTSASTPAVAGLLALVLSSDPDLDPRGAGSLLQAWAQTDEAVFSQPDPRWGAGLARLPVRDLPPSPCGRRPMVMPVFLLPLTWLLRRRRHMR